MKASWWTGSTLLIAVAAWSCASAADEHFKPLHFCTQEQAGSGHIAVLSVSTWDEALQAELQPAFAATTDGALSEIVPTGMVLESKLLDTLKIVASVATPSTSTSRTTKTTSTKASGEDDSWSSTDEATKTKAPGSAPAPDLTLPTDRKVTDLPSKSGLLDTKLSIDPLQRYALATALYQEIRLLDRYVTDAASRSGYRAYVVRLQASLMPSARNEPYDAYMSVSFFPPGLVSTDVPEINPQAPLEQVMASDSRSEASPAAPPIVSALGSLRACLNSFAASAPSVSARERLIDRIDEVSAAFGDSSALRKPRLPLIRLALQDLQAEASTAAVAQLTSQHCQSETTDLSWLLRKAIAAYGQPRTPVIVPLLVTDSLEAQASSRSTDVVRQYALALSALISGFSLSADAQKYSDDLLTTVGNDYNSLYTVSRLTENTLRVRFGALLQNAAHYAMVPQTHNISVLVLVPIDFEERARIPVVARTEFVDANTGIPLPQRTPAELTDKINRLFEDSTTLQCAKNIPDKASLVRLVSSNNLAAFTTAFTDQGCPQDAIPQAWLTLTTLYVGSLYSSATIALPEPRIPSWIAVDKSKGYLSGSDDGTQSLIVQVRGENLRQGDVGARIVFSKPAGTALVDVAPTKVEVRGTRLAEFTFPSLTRLSAGKTSLAEVAENAACPGSPFQLIVRARSAETPYCLTVYTASEKPQPKDAGFKLGALPAIQPIDQKAHFDLDLKFAPKLEKAMEVVITLTFTKDGKPASGSLQKTASRVPAGVKLDKELTNELRITVSPGTETATIDIALEQLRDSTLTIEAKQKGSSTAASKDVLIQPPPEKPKT